MARAGQHRRPAAGAYGLAGAATATATAMSKLTVSEIFGPTLQGEGPSVGRPTVFLRLGACNLRCVWCDTKYTWDWSQYDPRQELQAMALPDVADRLLGLTPRGWAAPMLVVSGGEPLLQQKPLSELLVALAAVRPYRVEIETAGTIAPSPELVRQVAAFNVSLKLAHSGNAAAKRLRPDAVRALAATGKVVWKFVAAEPADLGEVSQLVSQFELGDQPIYIMPEGISHRACIAHARALAPFVIAHGWSLTPRLQVDLWGHKRGV